MGDGDGLEASKRKPDASGECPFALRRQALGGFDDGFDAARNGSFAVRRGRELSRLGALCDKSVRRWVVQWLEHDRQSADL
jgi:hypothetical protein